MIERNYSSHFLLFEWNGARLNFLHIFKSKERWTWSVIHGTILQLPIHLISNECEWEKYKSNLRKWGRVYHKDAARISFFVKIRGHFSVKIEGILRRNPQKIQIIPTNLSKKDRQKLQMSRTSELGKSTALPCALGISGCPQVHDSFKACPPDFWKLSLDGIRHFLYSFRSCLINSVCLIIIYHLSVLKKTRKRLWNQPRN